MTSVIVVSTVRLYREGLCHVLSCNPRIGVVGASADVDDAVQWSHLEQVVVVVDVTDRGCVQLIRRLRFVAPDLPIVALGVPEEEDAVLECAEAGVAGYVTREDCIEDLVVAVESAARGEAHCSPRIVGALLRRVTALANGGPSAEEPRLTHRERQIVELIGQGLPNKTIAHELSIELPTVKNHVHNILEKLQVTCRADAVISMRSIDARRMLHGSMSRD